MEIALIKAAQLILILSIIVVLHEGGHFAAAKLFKTKVERFFLFFDVKFALFKKKIGDTVYGIGWLPLGGYVKIAGMIDESMDTEQLKSEPKPWEFRSKPAWQRLIIMLAGIFVNLILAIVIFAVMSYKNGNNYIDVNKITQGIAIDSAQARLGLKTGDVPVGVNGVQYDDLGQVLTQALMQGGTLNVKREGAIVNLPITLQDRANMLALQKTYFLPAEPVVIDSVLPSGTAFKAGVEKGDVLKSINGQAVESFTAFAREVKANANKKIKLEIQRNSELKNIEIPVNSEGLIGVAPVFNLEKYISHKDYSLSQSIAQGVHKTFALISNQIQSFALLWELKGDATKYVSGPIGMAKALPEKWNWDYFWNFTAMLSAVLAFMNILPIPGLDGGHALFTLYEMITGHKPSDKFMGIMQMVGAIILISLMVFIFGNDIFNLMR
ncbi:RIP metalloprotease RseP [Ornithobacterium rhinotracheale]|uniref:RIP metalloprotease RseP n=1 Tax=Ornithobacterium rhinotracheale TaxID=28251 RepID=UPI00129C757D|nr:RIP metalloprotease RseP [Ornithobacterium rhinotracheale]MRJ11296.1 RIP metalloprotease RseP [Ornithobacterium rhinotracheale]